MDHGEGALLHEVGRPIIVGCDDVVLGLDMGERLTHAHVPAVILGESEHGGILVAN